MLIQAKFFKQHLWRNKVGAEGRKEVKLVFFEALTVPIPPLPVQRQIVAYWERAIARAKADMQAANNLARGIPSLLAARLGLEALQGVARGTVFATSWRKITRWGVGIARQQMRRPSLKESPYPVVALSEVIADIQNGWSPKCLPRPATDAEWGVLKVGAVSFGVFEDLQNKALPADLELRPQYEVKSGDLIISRANISQYVGACAMAKNIEGGWCKRTLERQVHTQYYERSLHAQQPDKMIAEGRQLQKTPAAPDEVLKNPYMLEFLGYRNFADVRETDVEQAIITHLQHFLLYLAPVSLLSHGRNIFASTKRIALLILFSTTAN